MKKLFFIVAVLFAFNSSLNAQATKADSTVVETPTKMKARDRFVFNLSFDNVFHKETNGFATKWHSRGIGIYYMHDIPIKNSRVSIAPGIGFRHASYYHNSFMVEDSSGTYFNAIPNYKDNDNYKKHKLAVNYLDIPVELRFFSKPLKGGKLFKAALGFRASVKLTAVNKETNKDNGYFKKYKTKGYKDVSTLNAGPTFRIGYGAFNVFAYYSVLDLFKKNEGPSMTPFSIGLSITGL
ncbi:MAG: outer membrane beta-barrel protein [Chitinophagales bacterium]|nr:outer membrane beta-barrel protein [Bacteroidota bacterium]MCB9256906.1 outer membrane beta-barrel protein [Chitinophagales bacterium]